MDSIWRHTISKHVYVSDEQLREAVEASVSLAGVLRLLNKAPVGGNSTAIGLRIKRLGLCTEHFTGSVHNKGKPSKTKKTADQIFKLGTELDYRAKPEQLKRALLEVGVDYKCNSCDTVDWQGQPLTLEIDHINETYWDNRRENLQFLCPNCHSQKTKRVH